jgi:predicted aldo/keto reductase-like oxidoreductase
MRTDTLFEPLWQQMCAKKEACTKLPSDVSIPRINSYCADML